MAHLLWDSKFRGRSRLLYYHIRWHLTAPLSLLTPCKSNKTSHIPKSSSKRPWCNVQQCCEYGYMNACKLEMLKGIWFVLVNLNKKKLKQLSVCGLLCQAVIDLCRRLLHIWREGSPLATHLKLVNLCQGFDRMLQFSTHPDNEWSIQLKKIQRIFQQSIILLSKYK